MPAETFTEALTSRLTYFAGIGGGTAPYPPAWVDTHSLFVVFTTYPGCGVTCKPIFEDLREVVLSMKERSFLVLNFPFAGGNYEQEYTDYYKANGVCWPWVKLIDRLPVKNASGFNLGSSCPRLCLLKGDETPTVVLEDISGGVAAQRQKLITKLKKMSQGNVFTKKPGSSVYTTSTQYAQIPGL